MRNLHVSAVKYSLLICINRQYSDGGAVTDRLDPTWKAKSTSSRLTTTRLSGLSIFHWIWQWRMSFAQFWFDTIRWCFTRQKPTHSKLSLLHGIKRKSLTRQTPSGRNHKVNARLTHRSVVGNKCRSRINRGLIGTATSVTIEHSYNQRHRFEIYGSGYNSY